MKVEKRAKGKVVCKTERNRFTARQVVDLINEWGEAVKAKPGLTSRIKNKTSGRRRRRSVRCPAFQS